MISDMFLAANFHGHAKKYHFLVGNPTGNIPVISKCRFPVFAELCLLSVKDSNLRNVAAL